ncbi:MAG: helix-turn-helix transcriptional regulator [Clostridia bacterium]|nr:helix-turn-helix transcriptional regulator [Clostridia bacterium]
MTIGEKIKTLRIENGYTQEELAEYVGTTKQTIHKYETGIVTNIPASKIKSIADKLKSSPAYLMGWDENNQPDVEATSDIVIYSRDGKTIKKKLTKEQMDYLDKFINSISDDDVDL